MKDEVIYCFNPEKNKKLIDSRGISFEEVIALLENHGPLDVLENSKPEYRHQKIYIIDFSGYIYLVPFVEKESQILLITIIPSREATKNICLMERRKIMTNKKKQDLHLDAEEKALLDSFENGEWQSVKKLKAEKSKARQAAANYLRKGARINIRISETDLQQIKQKAAYEGLPYQTLIASLLHKYAAGHG